MRGHVQLLHLESDFSDSSDARPRSVCPKFGYWTEDHRVDICVIHGAKSPKGLRKGPGICEDGLLNFYGVLVANRLCVATGHHQILIIL